MEPDTMQAVAQVINQNDLQTILNFILLIAVAIERMWKRKKS